jgi:hypothetical protein
MPAQDGKITRLRRSHRMTVCSGPHGGQRGLSPDAYLYGSEFTRESTRRLQQQRLNDYVSNISMEATMSATTAANRSISAADAAASSASQIQNQALISSLRQAQPSGRIVLNLHPDSNQVADRFLWRMGMSSLCRASRPW